MNRKDFAERITAGIAGWFQQLAAQDLDQEVGEDAARVELIRMINAQQCFIPKTSQKPSNWPTRDARRIDVAVLGRKDGAKGWYGALEIKWPGTSNDRAAVRNDVIQDAVRVAFSATSNMNAHFVILGGTTEAIARLFDEKHPKGDVLEQQRRVFAALFSRDPKGPTHSLKKSDLLQAFPKAPDRTPPTVAASWTGGLSTELLAHAECKIGASTTGYVFVWQCNKTAKGKSKAKPRTT